MKCTWVKNLKQTCFRKGYQYPLCFSQIYQSHISYSLSFNDGPCDMALQCLIIHKLKPTSPASAGGFFTTEPPGKPYGEKSEQQ